MAASAPAGEPAGGPRRVPLIYGTDLFHPHVDPDDHFDLATVFAMPELDVRAILLDQGQMQKDRPGRIPVEQMLKLTGRRVPYAVGLSAKLRSPGDNGLDQPPEFQAAVDLLLKTLRESPEPVVVALAGSVRDLCAAFNREPELLRRKVARAYLNIGNLDENASEWNVGLDAHAYVGLMRSGLPVYWCPCLPEKQNRSTHWVFKHDEVLTGLPRGLFNYFLYGLQRPRPDELDPMAALEIDLRPWRHLVLDMQRNMWCTGPLIHAAGRRVYRVGDRWVAATAAPAGASPAEVLTFVPVRVTIDDQGHTRWAEGANPNMHLYRVTDPKSHEPAMKSCLRELLANLPMAPTTRPGAPAAPAAGRKTDPGRVVRVAILQASESHYGGGNPGSEANFALFARLAREAADAQPRPNVICFPEYALSGWPYPPEEEFAALAEAVPGDGPWYRRYRDLARQTGVPLLCSMVEAADGRKFNTACIIDGQGAFRGRYRKVHANLGEQTWWGLSQGAAFEPFELDGVRYGVSICSDLWFPETTRCLELLGADVILHQSIGDDMGQVAPVRAFDSKLPIVLSIFQGGGYAVDAEGKLLGKLPAGDAGWKVFTLHPFRPVLGHKYGGVWDRARGDRNLRNVGAYGVLTDPATRPPWTEVFMDDQGRPQTRAQLLERFKGRYDANDPAARTP